MNTQIRELAQAEIDDVSGGEYKSYYLGGGIYVGVRFNEGARNETCIGKSQADKVCVPMPAGYQPPK